MFVAAAGSYVHVVTRLFQVLGPLSRIAILNALTGTVYERLLTS